MRELLYVSYVDFDEPRFIGVVRKIESQIAVFEESGFSVTLVTVRGRRILVRRSGKEFERPVGIRGARWELCRTSSQLAASANASGCFVRFQFFCPHTVRMLRAFKVLNATVVVEIPTYPYDLELVQQGARGRAKLLVDKIYRRRASRFVDRFMTYSRDDEIYGTRAIEVKNGVDTGALPVSDYRPRDVVDLIAVSSMFRWHGYDRLLEGIARYYDSNGTREVVLHLVGVGTELPSYREFVRDRELQGRVIFHGQLSGAKLDNVFDQCGIGVSVLGVHRKNLQSASPLKSREYAARGLAVVSSVDEDFFEEGSPYLFRVPADDSPIDIVKLIEFHDRLAHRGDSTKAEIRAIAEDRCDMASTLSQIVLLFEEN